eukprot:3667-Prymnesium_polylepis.1
MSSRWIMACFAERRASKTSKAGFVACSWCLSGGGSSAASGSVASKSEHFGSDSQLVRRFGPDESDGRVGRPAMSEQASEHHSVIRKHLV